MSAFEAMDVQLLKRLKNLQGKTICRVNTINELKTIKPNSADFYIFDNKVHKHLEAKWVLSVLKDRPFEYRDVFNSDMSKEDILKINKELKEEY